MGGNQPNLFSELIRFDHFLLQLFFEDAIKLSVDVDRVLIERQELLECVRPRQFLVVLLELGLACFDLFELFFRVDLQIGKKLLGLLFVRCDIGNLLRVLDVVVLVKVLNLFVDYAVLVVLLQLLVLFYILFLRLCT